MPELPEVETVRRMLEAHAVGRTVERVTLSRLGLRSAPIPAAVRTRLPGRSIVAARRHGKFLLLDVSGGETLLSHLGMSGRWLVVQEPRAALPHVHARIAFTDGTELWFQDPRRFGMLRLLGSDALDRDPSLSRLGPDPVRDPFSAERLAGMARGVRTSVKAFLLDQRRIAGIGNIYASEILFRARVEPRRRAGALRRDAWERIAIEIPRVLEAAIEGLGTTFRSFRNPWDEPGRYGERLLVYDRAGEPCRKCGTAVRRIVQGGRSTFFCPSCQPRGASKGRVGGAQRARRRPG